MRRVLSQGKMRAGSLTVFYWLCRPGEHDDPGPRIAVVTSRKLGKAAVRNRVRRRISEIVRNELPHLPSCKDIVIVVRRRGARADFARLRQEVRSHLEIIKSKGEENCTGRKAP